MFKEWILNIKSFLAENKKNVIIISVLLLGIVISVYLVKQQQILKSRAEASPAQIQVTPNNPPNNDKEPVQVNTTHLQIIINKSDFEK